MNVSFGRGEVVAVREVWRGRVWTARPWIVVEGRPDRLVLWIPRELDLICRPDGSHELADEDDFAEAQRRGVILRPPLRPRN